MGLCTLNNGSCLCPNSHLKIFYCYCCSLVVFWQPTSSCCCSIRSNEQLSSTARSYQPSSTGCQCQIDWTTIIHCQILSTIIHWVSVSDRLNNYHPLSDPINHHPLGVSVRSTEQLSSTVRSYQPSSTGCQCQINWTTIIPVSYTHLTLPTRRWV